MSELCRNVNIDEFSRHFDVLFWCNFHGQIFDVTLMYIFDIKSTQLQRATFDVFLKGKKPWSI